MTFEIFGPIIKGAQNQRPVRICRISEREAHCILTSLEREQGHCLQGAPPGISKQLFEAAIELNKQIVDGYQNGELVYESDSTTEPKGEPIIVIGGVEEVEITQTYKAKGDLPTAPTLGGKKVMQISEMDFDVLFKEDPFGKINPPMSGVLFLCDELRIPVSGGFITERGYGEYPAAPFIVPPNKRDGNHFEITYPNVLRRNKIPMALGLELIALTRPQGARVTVPVEEDPLIWRVNRIKDELEYKVCEVDLTSPFTKLNQAALEKFIPTEEEQKYWQEALPLPQRLKEKIIEALKKNDHQEIMHLITSYIGRKDKTTGLTNFRYICHPRFGEFIRNNPDDLPLIMSELRVGHCDLLSWYTSALGRGYGIPVWVSTDLLTVKEGNAFNKSYFHSRNIFPGRGGKLLAYDSTVHCEFDKAYHPKILKDDLIDELEEQFQRAGSIEEKVRILREFNFKISELRAVAEKDRKVLEDTRKMQLGALAALFIPKGKFDPNKTEFRGQVANWDWLPKEPTPEGLIQLSEGLAEHGRGAVLFASSAIDPDLSMDARKQVQYLYNSLAKLRVPIYEQDTSPFVTGLDFFSRHPLTLEGLHSLHKEIKGHRVTPDFLQRHLNQVSALDLLTYFKSDECDEHLLWGNNNLLELSLWPLIKQSGTEFIRKHRYSADCKKFFKNNQIPDFDGDVEFLEAHWLDSFHNEFCSRFTSEEKKKIKIDLVNFAFEFQVACLDPRYRQDLLKRLGTNEVTFKKIALWFLNIRENYKRGVLAHNKSNDTANLISRISCALHLDSTSQTTFRKSFLQLLHELDANYRRGTVREHDDFRSYSHGDDIRKINWKIYGRTDRFYVQLLERHVKDLSTPLYVLFDHSVGYFLDFLKLTELIRNLQADSKIKGREIYIGSVGPAAHCAPGYYLIPNGLSIKPEDIIPCLFRDTKDLPREIDVKRKNLKVKLTFEEAKRQGQSGPFLLNGRLPPNLLYVSSSYGKTLAFQYLYGGYKRRCNLKTLWLSDDRFMLYPLVNDNWVENGYPEDLMEAHEKEKERDRNRREKNLSQLF